MKTDTINIPETSTEIPLDHGTFVQLQNLGDTELYFNIGNAPVSVGTGFCLPTKFSNFNVDKELRIGSITVISNGGTGKLTYLSQ